MKRYVAIIIGCLECEIDTVVIGTFTTVEEAVLSFGSDYTTDNVHFIGDPIYSTQTLPTILEIEV